MRWRVQGSHAGSGEAMLLDIEAESAVAAVARAHDRQMIVSQVARARDQLRRGMPFLLSVAAATLLLATAVLHNQLTQTRRALADAQGHAHGVLVDLREARAQLVQMQSRLAGLEGSTGTQSRALALQVEDLRGKLIAAEAAERAAQQRLAQADRDGQERARKVAQQVEELRRDAARLATARKDAEKSLAAAIAEAGKRQEQLARALKSAQAAAAQSGTRAATLDTRITELASQLKAAELQSKALQKQLEDARAQAELAPRHALAVTYDQAFDFMALHFGKPLLEPHRGALRVSGTALEQANTLAYQTDKERVFSATLQACVAADAPQEVLAENWKLAARFAATFAPRWSKADTWLAAAARQLAGKDESERLLLVTEHYRVTVWINKASQLCVQVEPS